MVIACVVCIPPKVLQLRACLIPSSIPSVITGTEGASLLHGTSGAPLHAILLAALNCKSLVDELMSIYICVDRRYMMLAGHAGSIRLLSVAITWHTAVQLTTLPEWHLGIRHSIISGHAAADSAVHAYSISCFCKCGILHLSYHMHWLAFTA